MLLWAGVDPLAPGNASWDPYPYILLNLVLSMLARLQGVILLIAAKRQDEPHRLLFRPAIRPATENLSTPVAGIPLPESMSDRSGFEPNGQDR
jgi:hypothetical protein